MQNRFTLDERITKQSIYSPEYLPMTIKDENRYEDEAAEINFNDLKNESDFQIIVNGEIADYDVEQIDLNKGVMHFWVKIPLEEETGGAFLYNEKSLKEKVKETFYKFKDVLVI